jgi:hypothetical protein
MQNRLLSCGLLPEAANGTIRQAGFGDYTECGTDPDSRRGAGRAMN